MLDKIINLCYYNWQKHLRSIDEQCNQLNVHSDKEYFTAQLALEKLEDLRSSGYISSCVYANMITFICDCHKYGWKHYRDTIGKTSFSQKYTRVKQLTNFDVKRECLESLPIMRIMSITNEYKQRIWKTASFSGAPVLNMRLACGV